MAWNLTEIVAGDLLPSAFTPYSKGKFLRTIITNRAVPATVYYDDSSTMALIPVVYGTFPTNPAKDIMNVIYQRMLQIMSPNVPDVWDGFDPNLVTDVPNWSEILIDNPLDLPLRLKIAFNDGGSTLPPGVPGSNAFDIDFIFYEQLIAPLPANIKSDIETVVNAVGEDTFTLGTLMYKSIE